MLLFSVRYWCWMLGLVPPQPLPLLLPRLVCRVPSRISRVQCAAYGGVPGELIGCDCDRSLRYAVGTGESVAAHTERSSRQVVADQQKQK